MNEGSIREQNIFSLSVQDIPQIIEIGDQTNLSKWSHQDYSEELERCDSLCLTYKNIYGERPQRREFIAGFIIARLIRIKLTIAYTFTEKEDQNIGECEILNIAVRPTFHRRGIGQKLFEATVEKCIDAKVESIWLEVRKNNAAAVKFYERNGFEIVYARKNYYQNPSDDALVMKAELSQTSFI